MMKFFSSLVGVAAAAASADETCFKGVDLMIVQDASLSCDKLIAGVKNGIDELLAKFVVYDVKVGVATFQDKPMPAYKEWNCTEIGVPLTEDTSAVKSYLENLEAIGGGDYAENHLEAVARTLLSKSAGWGEGRLKVMMIVTDSIPKGARAPLDYTTWINSKNNFGGMDAFEAAGHKLTPHPFKAGYELKDLTEGCWDYEYVDWPEMGDLFEEMEVFPVFVTTKLGRADADGNEHRPIELHQAAILEGDENGEIFGDNDSGLQDYFIYQLNKISIPGAVFRVNDDISDFGEQAYESISDLLSSAVCPPEKSCSLDDDTEC